MRLDDDLDAKVAAKIRDWRSVVAGNVAPTRVLLKKLLVGAIVMTALPGKTGYRFDGKIRLDELLALGGFVASLVRARWNQIVLWLRQIEELRAA